jgi:predicted transcriptional regulator
MDVLHYVIEKHPVTVRQVADHFTKTQGLARTTILNVMERLRKKGFLLREEVAGIFQYQPKQSKTELLRNMVGDFVARFLGGSVSPFFAYLAENPELSKDELAELRRIVRQMKDKK